MTIVPITLAAAAVTAAALMPMTSAMALPGEPSESEIVLADQQPIHRPTLDQIKADAEQRGIPLKQAIDDYVARAAPKLTKSDEPDGRVDIPEVTIDDLTAAEIHDLNLIANDDGKNLAETIDAQGWQSRFSDIADKFEADYPDLFSGAVKAEDGSWAWFGFKGEIPAAAVEDAKALPVKTTISGDLGYNQAEIAAESERVHQKVSDHPAVAAVTASPDARSGVINVSAQLKPGVKHDSALEKELNGLPALCGGRVSAKVVIAGDVRTRPMDGYIRGGGHLNGNCTTGFNLERAVSGPALYRTSTAQHCLGPGTESYRNHGNDSGGTEVGNVWYHRGQYGDFAINTAGSYTVTRTFYFTHTQKRYATSENTPRVGIRVCHYGLTSNEKCDTINAVELTVKFTDGVTVGKQVRTGRLIAAGGDSGGPFYYGGKAYGTLSGGGPTGTVFTTIRILRDRTDYKVFTK
ncbi:S1 family peptidase [Actinomadura sp. NEAU-AAG7]|uniref:S1 family peptidase n=1 Tax=Actinomadura sp. NEAU-AAG7 TaxID=2839640 RepID=UPI001BE40217|nr:S1 family peptidase [Actinomadura sp. NEAU-AAG7]MBT2212167.1 hypothetical protein [Actinomadura sp. NEAU-AAG7]